MAPDNDKEQELETKQVTYQEDEVEDDDDMFGGFDAGEKGWRLLTKMRMGRYGKGGRK